MLQEAGEMDMNSNYWRHLAERVRMIERQWRAHAKFAQQSRQSYKKQNNVEDIFTLWSFSLTDDNHLHHNAFTGVAFRPTYFLQLGMSDFLCWNPKM